MQTQTFPKTSKDLHAPRLIELSLGEVSQLFNSMDPSPFTKKDLDQDAEEFIVSWALDYPLHDPVKLRIHLEEWPADDPTNPITEAIHHYFRYRSNINGLDFRRLMKEGRQCLVIGLLFLGVCLLVTELISSNAPAWAIFIREGLTIAGWVAMWRPMEIYLYEWWPVRRKGQIYAKLSEMPVEVVHTGVDNGAAETERRG